MEPLEAALQELPEFLVWLEHLVKMDSTVLLEQRAQLAHQVPLERLEEMELLELEVSPVHQDVLDLLVVLVLLDLLVYLEPLVELDQLDLLEHPHALALASLAHQVKMVDPVLMEHLEHLDLREILGHLDCQEHLA